jgi:hypothetical protein
MKKFKIEVTSKKPKKLYGILSHTGQVTIGDFKENFTIPLDTWTLENYEQQWKEGLERIKTHDVSCLVVTVQNLSTNPLVELWTLYKQSNKIYIHNQLLNNAIMKELNFPYKLAEFNSVNCYDFINYPRETVSEDGEKISEWTITTNDI